MVGECESSQHLGSLKCLSLALSPEIPSDFSKKAQGIRSRAGAGLHQADSGSMLCAAVTCCIRRTNWIVFPFMRFSFGSLRPSSRRVAGESDDVRLLGHPVDRFSLVFLDTAPTSKSAKPLWARDADTGVTQMLKRDLQMFALRTWHRGPASPTAPTPSLSRWPSSRLRPFPTRPREGSSQARR